MDNVLCKVCGKLISKAKKSMLDHRSHVHSNLLDKYCRFCKHTFSVKTNLIEHMKRVHNSDDISKAYCRMANGDRLYIIAEDIKNFSDTFAIFLYYMQEIFPN